MEINDFRKTAKFRERMRNAYIDLSLGFQPNFFVSLVTNKEMTIDGFRLLLKGYCARLDYAILGNDWYRAPAKERIDGIVFVEHIQTNIHGHGSLRFPRGQLSDLQSTSDIEWNKICPSGSVLMEQIRSRGWAGYSTKEMGKPSYDEAQIILIRDFMSEKSLKSPTSN